MLAKKEEELKHQLELSEKSRSQLSEQLTHELQKVTALEQEKIELGTIVHTPARARVHILSTLSSLHHPN